MRLPFAITVAPADANRSAVARPIPEPAPVTTTTCLVRSMAAPTSLARDCARSYARRTNGVTRSKF